MTITRRFVFFFKQKTAYEMRISDWSSDVCSSDLPERDGAFERRRQQHPPQPTPPVTRQDGENENFTLVGHAPAEDEPDRLGRRRVALDGEVSERAPHRQEAADRIRCPRPVAGARGHGTGLQGCCDARVDRQERHESQGRRSEEHTSEIQSLMRNSYAV